MFLSYVYKFTKMFHYEFKYYLEGLLFVLYAHPSSLTQIKAMLQKLYHVFVLSVATTLYLLHGKV